MDTPVNFSTAVQSCKDSGGKLFEPMNLPANSFVAGISANKLGVDPPDYWIGITDEMDEGR